MVSITGPVSPDTISQHAYSDIAALQAAAHAIQTKLSQRILEVEARLQLGATEEAGDYYFDRETRLVRTRRDDKLAGNTMCSLIAMSALALSTLVPSLMAVS